MRDVCTPIARPRHNRTPDVRGGAPLDDAWAAEEAVRARAAKNVNAGGKADGFTFTIVRTGELRGNGPTSVVYGDYALTLVDNAFDVRMQDIDVEDDVLDGDDDDVGAFDGEDDEETWEVGPGRPGLVTFGATGRPGLVGTAMFFGDVDSGEYDDDEDVIFD